MNKTIVKRVRDELSRHHGDSEPLASFITKESRSLIHPTLRNAIKDAAIVENNDTYPGANDLKGGPRSSWSPNWTAAKWATFEDEIKTTCENSIVKGFL
jgi:hypothetical protein